MNDEQLKAIAHSLGDPERDFQLDPLTQEEIHAVIYTYEKEARRSDLDPLLRDVYLECVKILKNHQIFH